MDFKDLVNLYFERSNALQTYWSFYISIVLALLAFFGSLKRSRHNLLLTVFLSISFIVCAAMNLSALWDVTEARLAVKQLILTRTFSPPLDPEVLNAMRGVLKPATLGWVVGTHLSGDILTLAGIWYLALRKAARSRLPGGSPV